MKCEYCDQQIDANSIKCPCCGAPTENNSNVAGTPVTQNVALNNQAVQPVMNNQPVNNQQQVMNNQNYQMPQNQNNNGKKILLVVIIAVVLTLILSIGLVTILVLANKSTVNTDNKIDGIESNNPNYNDANYIFGTNVITNSSSGNYTYSSTTKVSTTKYGPTSTRTTTNVSTAATTIAAHTTQAVTTASQVTTTKYVNSNNNTSGKNIKRTIMMYVVGSNLESESNEASIDIQEIINSRLDANTEFIIYLGGSTKWGMNVDPNKNTYLKITNTEAKVIGETQPYNMGDASTLASFINNAKQISPNSDQYSLILWNHGAGIFGYGQDEKTNDLLRLNEISSALNSTSFKGSNKFEFIGFDACIMNTIEVLSTLSNFTNYVVASEENESGLGWNYYAFANASKLNTIELGKQIIDSFAEDNAELDRYRSNPYTLSMIDLTKVNSIVSEINKDFGNLKNSLNSNYEKVAKARAGTIEFGKISSTDSYDQVDIIHLIQNLNEPELNDIIPLVKSAVVYSNANLTNANGMGITFPYTSTGDMLTATLNYYSTFSYLNGYYSFIKEFSSIKTGASRSITTIEKEDLTYENDKVTLELSDEEMSNYYRAYYIVFKKDGEFFQPVYKGSNFKTNNNKLVADYNKKALYVSDNEGNSVPLMLLETQRTNRGSICVTPVMLQNWNDDGDLSDFLTSFKMQGGYLKGMLHDDTFDSLEIIPLENATDDQMTSNVVKGGIDLKDWRILQFTTYSYSILDSNGRYTLDWKSSGTVKGIEVKPNEEEYKLEMKEIDEGEYYIVTTFVDFQGNYTTSELIQIK